MKLVAFRTANNQTPLLGEIVDDVLYQIGDGALSMLHVISGAVTLPAKRTAMLSTQTLAPLRPGKILAIGRNYADHAAELGSKPPAKPLVFAKYPTCVIGDGEAIRWKTSITQQVDWEVELAVVIGKTAQDVPEADAYQHIFGYTVANDISARDLQDTEGQWTRAKGQDTFCPLGPCIVTRDDIPDPHTLNLRTEVNGTLMQDANTRDMIFKVPFLVSYLSQTFTLEPGDIILTGTPSGVGKGMTPPRYLGAGDVLRSSIEGIGSIENPCHPTD